MMRHGQRSSFCFTSRLYAFEVLLFTLSVGALILYIVNPPSEHSRQQRPGDDAPSPGRLHFVIPASKPDPNLCKTLLSGAALGYPTPAIINWQRSFEDPDLVEGGAHLAKIAGIHDYLASFDESRDEDLVLVVDGYDIWLQLRPQTLLDRYFDINRRADARIQAELGPAARKHGIRQKIVFGCQKRCWPWADDDPPCYAVPNSSLPHDIYGPATDVFDVYNEVNQYMTIRQRFLNSGTAIGTMRAMRKLLNQSMVQVPYEANFGSDQYIFSHIFGDQEIWRASLALDSGFRGPRDFAAFNPRHVEEVRSKAAGRDDGNFEFGIGVDYGSEIVLNTIFAEDDTEWLTFSQKGQLVKAAQDRGIEPGRGRLTGLASDVSTALPPFWTFTNADLPRRVGWENVSLLTDVWTGITPAVIHHNANRNGAKSLRETWWPFVWFQTHARILLDAYVYSPALPVAVSGYDAARKRKWWPYETRKGGASDGTAKPGDDDGWLRFDHICKEYHEELFRDGKGEWVLLESH